jgi:hypothetical protein
VAFGKEIVPLLENTEKWRDLCDQAVIEDDPEKLIVLIQEINRLLDLKAQRIKPTTPTP